MKQFYRYFRIEGIQNIFTIDSPSILKLNELITMHSGIALSTKDTCNSALEFGQN